MSLTFLQFRMLERLEQILSWLRASTEITEYHAKALLSFHSSLPNHLFSFPSYTQIHTGELYQTKNPSLLGVWVPWIVERWVAILMGEIGREKKESNSKKTSETQKVPTYR